MKRVSKVVASLVFACSAVMAWGAMPVEYHGVFVEASPSECSPGGWVKEMLGRQVSGLAKNHAVSGYPYDSCLWTGIIPKGGTNESWKPWWPYEQTGYLVDGLERLGIVTGDASVRAEAEANVRYILEHPAADGTLGPTHIGPTNWPEAVVFRALIASYEAAPNPAIPEALRRHYLGRSADYGKGRDAVNVETMLWTYSKTGDEKLLAIAKRTYNNFNLNKPASGLAALAGEGKVVEHGVTFNETAKLPAMLYMYTGDKSLLEATVNAYRKVDRDHMTASGMHTAEEKLDGKDPWRYTETCDVTDYTWSVGYLLMASGDATWADHIEKAVFNAGMGSITKDFKSHQYFSSPNQVVVTHGICKRYSADRLAYRPGHEVECCTGNVQRFLPNYALRQWMRTPTGGIVAAMYGPGKIATKVGDSAVTIEEETRYPFEGNVTFVVHTDKAVEFPLVMRIPGWSSGAGVKVNGEALSNVTGPGTFMTVKRVFKEGDKVELTLPMRVKVAKGEEGTASVERGPLVYSLKIQAKAVAVSGVKTSAAFPAWDITPASAWNYALDLGAEGDGASIQVVEKPGVGGSGLPWDSGISPVELKARARRISNWGLAKDGANPGFPKEAVVTGEAEDVTLVPYGETTLRLTVFPLTK